MKKFLWDLGMFQKNLNLKKHGKDKDTEFLENKIDELVENLYLK